MNSPEIPDESTESTELVQTESILDELSDEELISVNEAIGLSGLSKSLFYQRMNTLQIQSTRQGKSAFLHAIEVRAIRDYSPGGIVQVGSNSIAPTAKPQQLTASSADIRQIKVEAAQRVKAKRMAIVKVAQAMEENPDLLPADIRAEIEEFEQTTLATPIPQRGYYDPELLAQLVLETL